MLIDENILEKIEAVSTKKKDPLFLDLFTLYHCLEEDALNWFWDTLCDVNPKFRNRMTKTDIFILVNVAYNRQEKGSPFISHEEIEKYHRLRRRISQWLCRKLLTNTGMVYNFN